MMNAILIDDEQDGRDVLSLLIADYCPEVKVQAICSSGKEGVQAILKLHPDLVFLDIDMPDMNGFEVLDCVRHLQVRVIFVTAHNEHAIRAFKYSAVDYILKPPSVQDLVEAVEKVKNLSGRPQEAQYDTLLSNFRNEPHTPALIALPMQDGLQVVPVQEILYCRASRNYTEIHLSGQRKYLVSKPLKEFEQLLSPQGFFRIHHSALVSVAAITKYIRGEGGYVVMKDGATVEVSRQKKEELLGRLNKV